MDAVKIGELLKALRKSKGYTQQEVAEALYVTQKTVSRWENGEGIPDGPVTILENSKKYDGHYKKGELIKKREWLLEIE